MSVSLGTPVRAWVRAGCVATVVASVAWAASAAAQPEARASCALGEEGCFEDRDGRLRLDSAVYETLVARPRPDYLRTGVELTLSLGVGATWYWLTPANEEDWDFPPIEDRFGANVLRFDTNSFPLNHVGHGLDGMAWHVLARSNDLSLPTSFLMAFATSTAWEYVLEYREYVSINDVLATPVAGTATGEFAYWLGRYLNEGEIRSPVHGVARWTLGLPQAAHDAIDGGSVREPARTRDALGVRTDIWHRFRVSYGAGHAAPDEGDGVDMHVVRAEADFAAMPGFLRPGRTRRFFFDGNFTRSYLRYSEHSGSYGIDSFTEAVLLGYYWQSIPSGGSDGMGQALMVGVSTAFHYRREKYASFRDRLALMHFPGPAIDFYLSGHGVQLRVGGRLYGDFAGVHSSAYPQWADANRDERGKSILRRNGYYYAYGVYGSLELELRMPFVSVEGKLLQGRYKSVDGLDRWPEKLTVDEEASDSVAELEGLVRVMPFDVLFVDLRITHQRRGSRVERFRDHATLTRCVAELGAEF